MEGQVTRLYRAVEKFPPGDKEYQTPASKGRAIPPEATDDQRKSWDALSGWSTAAAAHDIAQWIRSANWIVRYDIPDGRGVTVESCGPHGHFDIRGDVELLKSYLAPDFQEAVIRGKQR